jgi:argininosuccinate lyase
MLWGGRFSHSPAELMRQFNDSINFDIRLWDVDLQGSTAYAQALTRAEIITPAEQDSLLDGLKRIRAEFEDGLFQVKPHDEDIHTAIERRLHELIGPVAGKLHTGRSRNDQVATDTRLWLRAELNTLHQHLQGCILSLTEHAAQHLDVLMAGYTHLQQAQPTRYSHWILSFAWALDRDMARLHGVQQRVNILPLGSGALAGQPYPLDRHFLAETLGFADISPNSMDAVADRDYILEFLSWAAITQTHLSTLAEDLIIYNSQEFGYITLADAYSTGSSLMPQKKNPDSLELIRGKTGRVIGRLTGLLSTIKGLPSTYNKDLQEDKETLFDVVDTLAMTLPIMQGVVETMTPNKDQMYRSMSSHLLATELADYLVNKGLPFREAHEVVGEVVKMSLDMGQELNTIPLMMYQKINPLFQRDIHAQLDFAKAVERRALPGGPAKESVKTQIAALRQKYSA